MKIKLSLSRKVSISIGSIFVLLLVIIFFFSKAIVQTGFARLEKQDTATNLVRLQKSIDGELDNLSTICGDWAPWDDTRDFMLGSKPEYVSSNLNADCISNLKLNFMLFVDNDGKILHTAAVDWEEKAFTQLPYELSEYIVSHKQLLEIKEPSESKSGLIILRDSIVLLAAQPISNSKFEKPVSGTLIVGRFLNDAKLDTLREQTCLDVKLTGSEIDENEIFNNADVSVKILDKNTISGYTKIYDIAGNNHITLKIDIPRKIYKYGRHIVFCFLITIAAIGLLIMAGLMFIMKIIIHKPLNRLIANFDYIGQDYNISTKLYTEREDEIGSLARSFDAMMNHLKKRMIEIAEKQNMTNSLNVELVKTSEKLQQANGELKNFVYIASHDLREPLRKIMVFGDMLQKSLKDKLQGEDSENLHFMIDGANRMTKMIEGLLLYSKVNTQAKPFETVNLNEILRQLRQFELAVVIEEKNVIIETPEPFPFIEGDAVQIRQLMQNLIANGIKYQSGNIPHIYIKSKPAANNMVRIEVTDNGIGIKPEYLSAVFTMFKRLHTNDQYEGTGIGLSVCKKIVERHNGQIGAESQFGQGSTFWFTVKAAAVPAEVIA
ncbi:MAG: hypothetical protein A2Y10_14915 [Planctomycetes bacterium GWF2_41_51]|nr:MAG: hypothetical protein A2Y10_14915 [Planctomycetes bacterium GWF2_41_51]HBG28506.1 hypothetical protein [Phycisphaerales bacterium]